MLTVIIIAVFIIWIIAKIIGAISRSQMTAEDHRQAAVMEARASTNERNAKRATAHAAKAQSHTHLAETMERRIS